jgi:hypothetical protein
MLFIYSFIFIHELYINKKSIFSKKFRQLIACDCDDRNEFETFIIH